MGGPEKSSQHKKITAVVIDDDSKSVDLLCHHLKTYCPELTVSGTAGSLEEGILLMDQAKPELVFLDIMLNTDTGFDLLDIVHQNDAEIIFISSFDEYALKAFKYSPVDYLLKPIDIKHLLKAIARARESILQKRGQDGNRQSLRDYIVFPGRKVIEIVRIAEILYCKSDGNYTTFYLKDREKVVAIKNIGGVEKTLPKDIFIRIHKQYLVNFNYVKSIHKSDGFYCQLFNGVMLPVSRRKQEEIQLRLADKTMN